jgi:hypothetical protein
MVVVVVELLADIAIYVDIYTFHLDAIFQARVAY